MSRVSPGTLLLAISAVMFGLLAAFVIRSQMANREVAAQPTGPQTYIVPVASGDLKKGRQIVMGDIAILRLTAAEVRERGYTQQYMRNTQQIMGRILNQDITKGQSFDTHLFYPEGTMPSVAERLQPGYRAVNITVSGEAAVAGFAGAGSVVDVLFRSEEGNRDEEKPDLTVTLLEAVEVLAFNRDTSEGVKKDNDSRQRSDTASVTLAVTPEQAAALQVVSGRGSLSMALRHPDDLTRVLPVAPRTLDQLLNRPFKERHKMEVYRGNQLSSVLFEEDATREETEERLVDAPDMPTRSRRTMAQ